MLFGALFGFFDRVGGGIEPCALELFDLARVHKGGKLGVDGHLGEQGEGVTLGGFLTLALAEELDFLAAIGAGDVAHILHDADDGDVHLLRHLHGLPTTMETSSCGEVTTIIPSSAMDWNTLSGTSPVPGGISTNR